MWIEASVALLGTLWVMCGGCWCCGACWCCGCGCGAHRNILLCDLVCFCLCSSPGRPVAWIRPSSKQPLTWLQAWMTPRGRTPSHFITRLQTHLQSQAQPMNHSSGRAAEVIAGPAFLYPDRINYSAEFLCVHVWLHDKLHYSRK